MIIELNSKSNFFDLTASKESGVNRTYLLNPNFNNKLDKIVFVSNSLRINKGIIPFIEVKYCFGRRYKRIEIVFKESKTINICKITKISEFDKDYFGLLSIIKDMKSYNSTTDFDIKGVLIFMTDYDKRIVENFLLSQKIHFDHFKIKTVD